MRLIDAADWPALLQPGHRVFVSGSSNEPVGLLDALARQPDRAAGVTFVQFPLGALNDRDLSALHPDARFETFFMTGPLAGGHKAGRVAFLPMHMRAVFDHVMRSRVDVVLTQAARDIDGRLRFGPNVDFVDAALRTDAKLVLEVNEGFEAPLGSPLVPEARVHAAVVTSRPVAEMAPAQPDEAATTIGRYVTALVPDGACIQTGIGAIPAAVLTALNEKNDLGLHGGLLDDYVMALIERGVVTGRCKPIDRARHVTGMALGTRTLFEWLAHRSDVVFRGANHTHEIAVIREIDRFVSINSAVEVDLYGQVNAEFAGGRQLSGTGGSVDFMRGARAAAEGRSIVALNATAKAGSVSRIVPKVELVTALRTDVDCVVTEYGIAELRGADLGSRARQLIAIAAPAFRDSLTDAARAAGLLG
jgi:4-hydroxybutyrate CoA-transferase